MKRKKHRTRWRLWRYRAEYLVFRVGLCVLQCHSPRRCARLADLFAFIVHRLLPRSLTRYDVARDNIRTAFGGRYSESDIDVIIHGMWVHLFRMIAEIAHLPRRMHLCSVTDVIHFRNKKLVLAAFASGRPVILLSGHFGNWEMAISVFGLFGFPMGVVARDLDNPYLDAWFRRFRQATGHRMICKKGGSDEMLERLGSGKHLAMLGDQDAGERGLFVDFFGRPASSFKSIALLALRYNALICVGYATRMRDDFRKSDWVRYELGCEDVIDPREINSDDDIREITQRYASALERAVRRCPEQYFWVHRRWKSQPGQRRVSRDRRQERKAG